MFNYFNDLKNRIEALQAEVQNVIEHAQKQIRSIPHRIEKDMKVYEDLLTLANKMIINDPNNEELQDHIKTVKGIYSALSLMNDVRLGKVSVFATDGSKVSFTF